jgi:hypothetical protein
VLENEIVQVTRSVKATSYQWFSLGLGILFISIGMHELNASAERIGYNYLRLVGWFLAGGGALVRFLDVLLGPTGVHWSKVGTFVLLVGLGLLAVS